MLARYFEKFSKWWNRKWYVRWLRDLATLRKESSICSKITVFVDTVVFSISFIKALREMLAR